MGGRTTLSIATTINAEQADGALVEAKTLANELPTLTAGKADKVQTLAIVGGNSGVARLDDEAMPAALPLVGLTGADLVGNVAGTANRIDPDTNALRQRNLDYCGFRYPRNRFK